MIRLSLGCCLFSCFWIAKAAPAESFEVKEDAYQITIVTPHLQASVRKKGYVSGVAGASFVDKKTGAKDLGFGLDIADWIMEPGIIAFVTNRRVKRDPGWPA